MSTVIEKRARAVFLLDNYVIKFYNKFGVEHNQKLIRNKSYGKLHETFQETPNEMRV